MFHNPHLLLDGLTLGSAQYIVTINLYLAPPGVIGAEHWWMHNCCYRWYHLLPLFVACWCTRKLFRNHGSDSHFLVCWKERFYGRKDSIPTLLISLVMMILTYMLLSCETSFVLTVLQCVSCGHAWNLCPPAPSTRHGSLVPFSAVMSQCIIDRQNVYQ